MDNKKLIGTIVGVIGFVALIAGATFAWLSVTATVNNQFVGGTKNFIINYGKGTDIGTSTNKVLQLRNPTKSQVTTGKTTVTAAKTERDAPASHFILTLNLTTNTFVTDSVIYAACKTSACPTTALATVAANGTITCGTGVTCGKITHGSKTAINVYDDTTTFNTDAAVDSTSYDVYLWIDSVLLSNEDMNASASIAGNISASATQVG